MERTTFKLGALVLAAGASRRFGADDKLLAEIGGTPMLLRTVCEVIAAALDPVIVVTGAGHDAYARLLSGAAVRLVANPRWNEGMGGSIATGAAALPPECDGAFIVPADMPNLSSVTLKRLAQVFAEAEARSVVVPVTGEGKQRNPVLWPRQHFAALAALSGHKGGKSLLDSGAVARVDVVFDDASLFADVDTQDDYARITGARP